MWTSLWFFFLILFFYFLILLFFSSLGFLVHCPKYCSSYHHLSVRGWCCGQPVCVRYQGELTFHSKLFTFQMMWFLPMFFYICWLIFSAEPQVIWFHPAFGTAYSGRNWQTHVSCISPAPLIIPECIWIIMTKLFVSSVPSDLSRQGTIQNVIMDSFSSPNEEVKSAASYALGKYYPKLQSIFPPLTWLTLSRAIFIILNIQSYR